MSFEGGIGVLGGTFDPIHLGHLVAASEVHDALGLSSVVFVPAGQPWQKAGRAVSPARTRLRMTELAVAGDPRFRVSPVDVDRAGPTFTVDTVADLRAELGGESALLLLIGADALGGLPSWHRVDELLTEVRVVVVGRPGFSTQVPHGLPADRFVEVATTPIGVSATQLRARARAGSPLRYLVPDPVLDFIETHAPYGKQQ